MATWGRRAVPRPEDLTALVFATAAAEDGACGGLLVVEGRTLLGRMCQQLREQGAADVLVLTRPEWAEAVGADEHGGRLITVASLAGALDAVAAAAAASDGSIVLVQGEILTHSAVLNGLLRDPRVATGVVSGGREMTGSYTAEIRSERGRVVAAASAYHAVDRPSGTLLGMLKVSAADRAVLTEAASELADLRREQLPPAWEAELAEKVRDWGEAFFATHVTTATLAAQLERVEGSAEWLPVARDLRNVLDDEFSSAVLHRARVAADDVVALLVVGLVRRNSVLTLAHRRELFWSRPLSQRRADADQALMAAVDEDAILLRSAVKATDGFFTTFLVSPYSKYIARWCARRNLTPNAVTTFSMALGLAAAAAFSAGTRPGLVLGGVLLQIAFTFDCVDGQLARYTRQFSEFGAWLDSMFDRGKEYAAFAGLTVGAMRAGAGSAIWLLAAAALGLQTFRHSIDFSYAAAQHNQIAAKVHTPLAEPRDADEASDGGAPATGSSLLAAIGRAGIAASHAFEQRPWMKWAKRILVLPIGERFALISITAAIFNPRVTFVALLAWGCVAAVYTVTGRVLRSFA